MSASETTRGDRRGRIRGRAAPRRPPSPKVAVTLVAAALTGGSLPVFLVSALSPRITADLAIGPAALGFGVSSFFLATAAMSIPGGRVADRYGARTALRGGLAIAVVGGLGVASLATGAWSLAVILFVAGTSLGFIDTGGARAISARVRTERQGFAFGVKEASIPVASLLAGIAVPVIGAQAGWRWAFVLAAGLALLIAALIPRTLETDTSGARDGADPMAKPGTGDALSEPGTGDAMAEPGTGDALATPGTGDALAARGAVGRPLGRSGRSPSVDSGGSPAALVPLAIAAALGGGAASSAATFLVPSAVTAGTSAASAGLLLSVASAVGIGSRLSVGFLADRWIGGELRIVASLLGFGAVGVLLLATDAGPLVIPGAVLAIGAGWGWTGLVFLAAVRIDPHRPARAAGGVLAGLGSGGAAGPAIFGLIVDNSSYATAWSFAGIAMLTAAASVLVSQRLRRDSGTTTA